MARATRSSAKASTDGAKTYPYPKAKPKTTRVSKKESKAEPQEEVESTAAEDEAELEIELESKPKTESRSNARSSKPTKSSAKDSKTYPYPKASPRKLKASRTKTEPETQIELDPTPDAKLESPKETKSRSGKDSHLYTDDNPATTLHGTGFKDVATARHTIELVQKRSLLYQFQTINTMYNRAKHHPHSSNNKDMQAAMAVFRGWLDVTYPTARDAQVDFKPLLRRDVVEKYLPRIRSRGIDTKWSEMYIALPKGKRLANVLMDNEKPGEADLARVRQDFLEDLMSQKGDGALSKKDDEDLWDGHGDGVSSWHLKCIAYGWSPSKPDTLLTTFESSENRKEKTG